VHLIGFYYTNGVEGLQNMLIIPVNIELFTRDTGYKHLWARRERARRYTREKKLAQKSGTRFAFCAPFRSSYIL